MENFSQLKKIAIVGEKMDIIFFKGLGMEIFPVKDNVEEVLDSLENRSDLGIIFVCQEFVPKIKREKWEEWQKKTIPVVLPLSLREKKEFPDLMVEILKKAIGKEIAI